MSPLDTVPERTSGAGGLTGLMGLQAWVWTSSVLPKITSSTFLTGFVGFVRTAPPMRPALYGHLVTPVILAAPALFAVGSLVTELALAVTFVVTTVALLRHRRSPSHRALVAGAVASLVAAGFALNLALLVGDAAPWRLGDPFDSGVAIEYLLVGLALVTAATAYTTIRGSARRPAPEVARGDRNTPPGRRAWE